MAIQFSDGFDAAAATADLNRVWGGGLGGWTWTSSGGRLGTGAITVTNSATSIFTFPSSTINIAGSATHCVAFWLKISAIPAATFNLYQPFTNNSVTQGFLSVASGTGFLTLRQTDTTIRATGVTNVCDNNWHWIEVYWTNLNNGVMKCYVDGVQQWSSAVAWNLNNGILGFFFTGTTTITITIDDVIFWDNTAPFPQVADLPIGPKQINTLRPNGDNTIQFTPDTGVTNFNRVNEVAADGDTSYVQDSTSGHQDLYNYDDLAFAPASITSVVLNSVVKNPGAGTISFKNRCKSGATTSDGTAQVAQSNYLQTVKTTYGQDPNTSALWTGTNLNAALFGVTVV